jgi:DNA polymerase III subunit delta
MSTGSVHLVKGDDPILRGAAVDRLVERLLEGEPREFALEDFTIPGRKRAGAEEARDDEDGGDPGVVQAVVTALASPPFVTARRVVVVHEAGALNTASAEAIVPFVAQPMDGVALVLVAGGGRMPVVLEKALKAADVATVSPESERTDTVLKSEARRAGIGFTADASKLVAEHLGEDAGRVVELVALLHGAFGDGAMLDAEAVEPYLGDAGGVPRYELTNAIDRGDTAGALDALHRLLTATSSRDPRPLHPMQVMASLVPHYQRMLKLDDPAINTEQDAVTALGGKVKPYPARRALESAQRHGTDGLREALGDLARAELDLRGATGAGDQTVIEVLVARLASLSRRRGGPVGARRR